jgi:hypothetical protein
MTSSLKRNPLAGSRRTPPPHKHSASLAIKFYGSLESLVEYSPNQLNSYYPRPDNRSDIPERDALDDLLQEKVASLSDTLAQIERDIKSRQHLSQQLLADISQHYSYLKTKLYDLDNWQFGRNRSVETRRSKLETQLDTLNQETRQEQLQCWRDTAQLTKEFRDWFKQYRDLLQRVNIILSDRPGNRAVRTDSLQSLKRQID